MGEIQAMIQEFKNALHFASLPHLVCSKFCRLQGKLNPICTHEDMAGCEGSNDCSWS